MKLLKTSVLLASALCIAACSAPTTENKSSVQSTQSTTKKSDESATSSTTTTTKAETTTSTTVATTTQQTTTVAASRKIDFAAIANGDLSSIWGTYPASSGVFTIKDNKTIILEISGDIKVMHIETINQYNGLTVLGANMVSINGQSMTPPPGARVMGPSLFPFYIVPAGTPSPEVTGGTQDISRNRVVTYNNFFYLD